jgi:hypothetical protein
MHRLLTLHVTGALLAALSCPGPEMAVSYQAPTSPLKLLRTIARPLRVFRRGAANDLPSSLESAAHHTERAGGDVRSRYVLMGDH